MVQDSRNLYDMSALAAHIVLLYLMHNSVTITLVALNHTRVNTCQYSFECLDCCLLWRETSQKAAGKDRECTGCTVLQYAFCMSILPNPQDCLELYQR